MRNNANVMMNTMMMYMCGMCMRCYAPVNGQTSIVAA